MAYPIVYPGVDPVYGYIPTKDAEGNLIKPGDVITLMSGQVVQYGDPSTKPPSAPLPDATQPPVIPITDTQYQELIEAGAPTTTEVPFAPKQPLQPYIQDGKVDLVQLILSGDTAAIKQAEELFSYEDMREARYLAKQPVTLEQYEELGGGIRSRYRVITPVTAEEWLKMSDKEKARHFLAQPVKGVAASKLGPGTLGKTAYYDPSLWERVTPWKEELGETADDLTRVMPRYVAEGLGQTRNWIADKIRLKPKDKTPACITTMDNIRTNVVLGVYDLFTIPAHLSAVSFAVGGQVGKYLRETDPTQRVEHLKEGAGIIKETAVGMGKFLVEIPSAVAEDPTKTAYYGVMLAPIGIGVARTAGGVAKRVATALHPYGIDPRALAVEVKIAWTEAPRVLGSEGSIAAVAEAIRQQITRTRKLGLRDYTEIAKVIVRPGYMKRRTAAVVRDDAGNILLGVDRSETPGVYSLVGGQVDPVYRPGQIGWTKNPRTRQWELDIKGATHGQVKSETGIGLADVKFLPSYSGFTTHHSFPGTYIFLAKAKGGGIKPKLDYVKKGELTDAIWWDGKSNITVYPSTYYVLKALADSGVIKADIGNVKMYTKDAKARWQTKKGNADLYYGDKVKSWKESGGITEYRLKGDVWQDGKIVSMPKERVPWEAEAQLEYRLSPMQTQMSDVLYHATADATRLMTELQQKGYIAVKGELYSSPQAALNFLALTAHRAAPVNPAIIAIRVPKNVLEKQAEAVKTTWPKGKGVESEVVFKEKTKLYPTDVNFFARHMGTSGRQVMYTMKDGKLGLRVANKGQAVTGETFTIFRGRKRTCSSTVIGNRRVELEHPVTMTPGRTVPIYWTYVKGGVNKAPSILDLYAVQLKAMREAVYDTAVTTGGIARDLVRMRKPRSLQQVRLSYGIKGAFEPISSPLRFTTRAYGDIKTIIRQLETDTQKALKYAKTEGVKRRGKGKGEPVEQGPPDYVAAVEQATNAEIQAMLKNPKTKKMLEEYPEVFNKNYEINLMRYTTAFELGQRTDAKAPPAQISPTQNTYIYDEVSNTLLHSKTGRTTPVAERTQDKPITVDKRRAEPTKDDKAKPTRVPLKDDEGVRPTPFDDEDKSRITGDDDENGRPPPPDDGERRITGINGDDVPPPPQRRPFDVESKREEILKRMPPGTELFPMGIVDVIRKPPYTRASTIYVKRKEPEKGKGSMERGLHIKGGLPPARDIMRQGFNRITITDGTLMTHSQAKKPSRVRKPAYMGKDGKARHQRRGITVQDILASW